MTKNLDKVGLSSIVDDYQLFYIDLWGVVHDGVSLHEKAINTLKEITKKDKEYVLLTNAPRPNSAVKIFLEKMGMEKEIRDHVYTSGEAALSYLNKNHFDDKFFHIGPPRDFDLFKDFKQNKSKKILESKYILCTGLYDDYDSELTYYKNFFCKKHNVDPTMVETYFGLLKRTAKKNKIEIFRVSSGPRKIKNALNILNKAVYNINKKNYPKNLLKCEKCEFNKSKWCP